MSLEGAYESDNIFARILRGEAPCVAVHDDAVALTFMDIFPQGPGHTLVVPRGVEARNLLDFPTEKLGALMTRVQAVARAVVPALGCEGVTVTQFNGAPAGQTVFHLHVHVIPRWRNRELGRHGAPGPADMADLRAQADRIAAELRV
jgi:histidine triad (HIT) family protein